MKNRLLYLTFILLLLSACSINKEIFKDGFNNNSKDWSETKKTYQEYFFRYGYYNIINKEDGRMNYTYQPLKIDQDENFIIETSVALNWKDDGAAYLIYGYDKKYSNYYCVRITKEPNPKSGWSYKEVYIGKKIDGEWVGEWKGKKIIKDFGQQNIIKIKKKGNYVYFYVNGRKIYSKEFEPFFGDAIGLGCGAPQNVSFDYLVVKQDKQNFSNSYVYNTSRQNTSYSSSSAEIKLKKSGGVYEIPVELNGVLKISFIFDSGASDVSISPDVALTLMRTGTIDDDDWMEGEYYRFADGTYAKSMRFKLKSVNVGGIIIKDVTCSISNNLEAPMLLGQSVLSRFGKYTFDYSSKKLIIE